MEYITLAVAALAVLIAWRVYVDTTRSIEGIKKFTVDELTQFTKGNLTTDKRLTKLEKTSVSRADTIKIIFKRISQLERKDMKEPKTEQPVEITEYVKSKKDFAKRICNIRTRKNLTQKALADKIGVVQSLVYAWENEVCLPRKDNLNDLAKALNTTPEYLLHGASAPIAKAM